MKVLLDTDALLAGYLENDASHQKAVKIMKFLDSERAELYVSNLVLLETATILSHRLNQKMATSFLADFDNGGFKTIFVDEVLTLLSWRIFKKQTKKGTSFVDCSNLILFGETRFDAIFSFDKFYKRNKLKMLTIDIAQ